MMVKPEQLKKVAEYRYPDKPVRIDEHNRVLVTTSLIDGKESARLVYNPLQNSDQDAEIEVKFKINTAWFDIEDDDKPWTAYINKQQYGEGETPKEARLMAAIAYVEGLEEVDDE